MRLCGVCARPTAGETVHPACQTPRTYNDPVHRAMSAMYQRANVPCADCGRTGTPENPITAGHVVPRAEGGPNVPENYVPQCRECNGRNGRRTGTE